LFAFSQIYFWTISAQQSKQTCQMKFSPLLFPNIWLNNPLFIVTTTSLTIWSNLRCYFSVQWADSFDWTMFSFCPDIVQLATSTPPHNPLVWNSLHLYLSEYLTIYSSISNHRWANLWALDSTLVKLMQSSLSYSDVILCLLLNVWMFLLVVCFNAYRHTKALNMWTWVDMYTHVHCGLPMQKWVSTLFICTDWHCMSITAGDSVCPLLKLIVTITLE